LRRIAVGAKQAVPHRNVAEVVTVDIILVMDGVQFRRLNQESQPRRGFDIGVIEIFALEFESLARHDARQPLERRNGCSAILAVRSWEFSEFTRLRRRGSFRDGRTR
jgi:hypothetical protein